MPAGVVNDETMAWMKKPRCADFRIVFYRKVLPLGGSATLTLIIVAVVASDRTIRITR
jgi:hypothetical protein